MLTSKDNTVSLSLCLYVADPATLLASNSVFFLLWEQLVYSLVNVCIITSLISWILKFWAWISSSKLHSAPGRSKQLFHEEYLPFLLRGDSGDLNIKDWNRKLKRKPGQAYKPDLFSLLLYGSQLNIFTLWTKTRLLRTPFWALGNTDHHFPPSSDIL